MIAASKYFHKSYFGGRMMSDSTKVLVFFLLFWGVGFSVGLYILHKEKSR